MKLRVRASRISVTSEAARFDRQIAFGDGLTLIRAENNMGKSTMLTSILYTLGWEGMLGSTRAAPFTPAVTDEIAEASGFRRRVLESAAMAELEDGEGRFLSVERAIKSETARTELVRTWEGRALGDPASAHKAHDYYVREKGAAQREAGYQRYLAEFIGWTMPEVSRWSGDPVPLYMEIVAPLLFIEQTRGWSWVASVVPRYLQVRDPERRAVEFLLSLDSLTRARERDELTANREEARGAWRSTVEAFLTRAEESGARIENVPREATPAWPPSVPPAIELLEDEDWAPIEAVLSRLRREQTDAAEEIPRVEQVEEEIVDELARAEERLGELSGYLASSARDVREQQAELRELETRISALREDKGRYEDALRLREFGSREDLAIDIGHCPTCDQALPTTLQGPKLGAVLTLEQNKTLIDEELKTFKAMREDAREVLHASKQRQAALEAKLNDTRRTIRAQKATLTQPAGAPSKAAIARQVRIADRIEGLEDLEIAQARLEEQLEERSREYRQIVDKLAQLGERGQRTNNDREKLDAFQALIREQLDEYGFSSIPPDEVELAPDSYMPFHREEPLRAKSISASDSVRLVWAYVVGLLEMSRTYETAHPGLLIMDEPGQQEVKVESLEALLHRLARSSDHGQQVIVASSKKPDVVRALLEGLDADLQQIDGYVLKPES